MASDLISIVKYNCNKICKIQQLNQIDIIIIKQKISFDLKLILINNMGVDLDIWSDLDYSNERSSWNSQIKAANFNRDETKNKVR